MVAVCRKSLAFTRGSIENQERALPRPSPYRQVFNLPRRNICLPETLDILQDLGRKWLAAIRNKYLRLAYQSASFDDRVSIMYCYYEI
jgi:hypothetical protein